MSGYSPVNDLSSFGEQLVVEPTPVVQLQFPYNINTKLVNDMSNNAGSIGVNMNMARLQSGASADSSGVLCSRKLVKYNPGQGGLCRFTARYTTGVAGNHQHVGIGNHADGFFFGYHGTVFGTMHRKGGKSEVRTLTVTTKSTTAEDITITLNDVAKTDVTVSDATATDVTTTANEIAAADYSDVGFGWDATACGDTVVFVSRTDDARSGAYTLSGATPATAGTFAQTLVGVAATDTHIAQTDWNIDPMLGDGRGDSGVALDPTKGNVYQIQYQWLGFGAIVFCVERPDTGRIWPVHRVQYANANLSPSINNPSLPLYGSSINSTNTTNMTVHIGSMMGATEGRLESPGDTHGYSANAVLTGVDVETPIVTLKNKLVYQGDINRIPIKILMTSVAAEHTKTVRINFYKDAVITGASFSDLDTATSVMEVDTSATGFTGGDLLFSVDLGRTGNELIILDREDVGVLNPGEAFTITVEPSSVNGAEASASFNWLERH